MIEKKRLQLASQIADTEPVLARKRIAVLIPCYNEELTVGSVVKQFREVLPTAEVYVFDNNSTDRTVEVARLAGASVAKEKRQGKGFVVQSMFQQVDADIYVMVDGDGTYPPQDVRRLIEPILTEEADMVVGSRLHNGSRSEFKSLNRLGNRLFLALLNWTFKVEITDLLSGYRAFTRQIVKELPLFGGGFETETELTIKALARGYRIAEIPVNLTHRPEGSFSKIRIVHDGLLIANTIMVLFRDYKPLTFFGSLGLLFTSLGLIPGLLVIFEFMKTGLIRHFPSAVLAVGLVLTGMFLTMVGLILHTIVRRSQEFDHQIRTISNELNVQIASALAHIDKK